MAFQKTMDYKGLAIPDAYLKIIGLSGDKNAVFYTIGIFVNKEQSEDKKNSIKNLGYSFTPSQEPNAPRWDKQAYDDAKARPELEGAINILENGQTL